jgi:hypothetical protein
MEPVVFAVNHLGGRERREPITDPDRSKTILSNGRILTGRQAPAGTTLNNNQRDTATAANHVKANHAGDNNSGTPLLEELLEDTYLELVPLWRSVLVSSF